jgi:hypothetical protein
MVQTGQQALRNLGLPEADVHRDAKEGGAAQELVKAADDTQVK